MSTLPSPGTNKFPADSIEKKVYKIVEGLSEYIPITNDRNRLGFNLYKFVKGEGDEPEILVKTSKIKIVGIEPEKLAEKINSEIKKIK